MATAIVFLAFVIGYCLDAEAFAEFTSILMDTHGKHIIHFAVIYDVISLFNSKD